MEQRKYYYRNLHSVVACVMTWAITRVCVGTLSDWSSLIDVYNFFFHRSSTRNGRNVLAKINQETLRQQKRAGQCCIWYNIYMYVIPIGIFQLCIRNERIFSHTEKKRHRRAISKHSRDFGWVFFHPWRKKPTSTQRAHIYRVGRRVFS